jgi:hypothetical protein
VIKKIYVDMDEVLTDFEKHYEHCFGRRWRTIIDTAERWKPLNENPNWYSKIPPREDARWLMEYLRSLNIPLRILTSGGWNWVEVGAVKTRWCKDHFDIDASDVLVVQNGREKYKFAGPSYVLIDDMLQNIEPWTNMGGIGIVHKNAEETIQKLKEFFVA